MIPYEEVVRAPAQLPKRPLQEDYVRPPIAAQKFVPEVHAHFCG